MLKSLAQKRAFENRNLNRSCNERRMKNVNILTNPKMFRSPSFES